MERMPGVLMIAYYFPPMGGAGVQRTLKFVKYLPNFGWQPHVLAIQRGSGPLDRSLEAEIPAQVAVTRTPVLRLPHQLPWKLRNVITRWMLTVDEQVGWLPYAVPAGLQLIEVSHDIKLIYSTSAPYTAHLIAQRLHEQTNLPWVADFRDPWTENPFVKAPTRFHQRLNEALEQKVFSQAERVIMNTDAARERYAQKYPQIHAEKFINLPNGYDATDIPVTIESQPSRSIFSIVHIGSLSERSRSSKVFLQACQAVIGAGQLPVDRVRIRFIGNMDKETGRLVRQLGLEDTVEVQEYLPHHLALEQLSAASLLLLIPSYGVGAELFVPGKLYEYLALRKPILCLALAGDSADLITRSRTGWVVKPRDVEAIAGKLVELYHLWEQGRLQINPDLNFIASFERKKLTERLAGIFDQVTGMTR